MVILTRRWTAGTVIGIVWICWVCLLVEGSVSECAVPNCTTRYEFWNKCATYRWHLLACWMLARWPSDGWLMIWHRSRRWVVTLLRCQQHIYQKSQNLMMRQNKTPLPQTEQERHRQSRCFGNWLRRGLGIQYYEMNCRQWEQLLYCFVEHLHTAVELE